LVRPLNICRNPSNCPCDEREEEEGSKSSPDDLSRFFNPIDLGENITENIGEREDDSTSVEGKWSDVYEFHTRDVGDDEGGDEESGDGGEHEMKL
jgi:hypothetical protein